ncbi:MAG: metallophosphoesterase [Phycisphaerae bacterium]|jgi:putative phosphoesterase
MLIGLMSDTHDRMPAIRAALDLFHKRNVDMVIHAGDVVAPFAARLLADYPGQVHVLYGNNDGERRGLKQVLPQIQDGPLWLDLAGHRVLVHHYLQWCSAADLARADVVISGHTHECVVEERDGRLLVNPGECCGWITGHCRVALLELETHEVESIEVLP